MNLWTDTLQTPLGLLRVVTTDEAVCAVTFDALGDRPTPSHTVRGTSKRVRSWTVPTPLRTESLQECSNPLGVTSKLQQYFDGQWDALANIPVDPGGTPFQQTVWATLRMIPIGTVLSYGQLAHKLNKPGASRAIGLANSKNPIALIIPCHRIIGARGHLTGYAWGLERKQWLLQHEGVSLHPPAIAQLPLPYEAES